jgi:hypothetical protein
MVGRPYIWIIVQRVLRMSWNGLPYGKSGYQFWLVRILRIEKSYVGAVFPSRAMAKKPGVWVRPNFWTIAV